MSVRYEAVILAGGRADWLQDLAGTNIRSLAKINGKPLISYIMEALRASGRIHSIYVATDSEALKQFEAAGIVGYQPIACDVKTLAEVCLVASAAVEKNQPENHKILFVCDDIPLLTAEAINSFLAACEDKPEGEIYWTVIRKETCEEQFPEGVRTYGPLADGKFTGGNVSLMTYSAIAKTQDMARLLFKNRKHPVKLCSLLGWGFVLKALLHFVASKDVEKRCTELMGVNCKAIISSYACIGMDMDKPKDWELVNEQLIVNS